MEALAMESTFLEELLARSTPNTISRQGDPRLQAKTSSYDPAWVCPLLCVLWSEWPTEGQACRGHRGHLCEAALQKGSAPFQMGAWRGACSTQASCASGAPPALLPGPDPVGLLDNRAAACPHGAMWPPSVSQSLSMSPAVPLGAARLSQGFLESLAC